MAGTLTVQNIEGPSSGSDANTVIMGSGQKLIVPEHVIGFASTSYNTQITFTTTTWTTTNLSLSYTNKRSDSKLLLSYNIPVEIYDGGSNSEVIGELRWYKDSSQLSSSYQNIQTMQSDRRAGGSMVSTIVLDAGDTSSHTWEIFGKVNTDQFTVFRYNYIGHLTLMEIAQ